MLGELWFSLGVYHSGNKLSAIGVQSRPGGVIMSLFCQAAVYLLLALPAVAQSQAFGTIAIKPARSADARDTRVQMLANGDFIASSVPVVRLLSYAYDAVS